MRNLRLMHKRLVHKVRRAFYDIAGLVVCVINSYQLGLLNPVGIEVREQP